MKRNMNSTVANMMDVPKEYELGFDEVLKIDSMLMETTGLEGRCETYYFLFKYAFELGRRSVVNAEKSSSKKSQRNK